jgi:hypothetical protein
MGDKMATFSSSFRLKYTDPDGYRSLALIAATITKAIVVNVTNVFVQMAIAYAVTLPILEFPDEPR